jgi:hypothetical protein
MCSAKIQYDVVEKKLFQDLIWCDFEAVKLMYTLMYWFVVPHPAAALGDKHDGYGSGHVSTPVCHHM